MPKWFEIVMWTVLAFASLFFITKMIGKRQINQMTFFDYITGIAIGEIGAHMAMHLENKVMNTVIALSLFAVFPVIIGWASLKSNWIRQFVNGKARALIQKGEILTDNLAQERMTREELMARLRLKNVYQVADVELAIMENDGNISVQLRPESSPLTLGKAKDHLSQVENAGPAAGGNNTAEGNFNHLIDLQADFYTNQGKWNVYLKLSDEMLQVVECTIQKSCTDLHAYQTFVEDISTRRELQSLSLQLQETLGNIRGIQRRLRERTTLKNM